MADKLGVQQFLDDLIRCFETLTYAEELGLWMEGQMVG
jgi:hypothetical protein